MELDTFWSRLTDLVSHWLWGGGGRISGEHRVQEQVRLEVCGMAEQLTLSGTKARSRSPGQEMNTFSTQCIRDSCGTPGDRESETRREV